MPIQELNFVLIQLGTPTPSLHLRECGCAKDLASVSLSDMVLSCDQNVFH